MIDLDARVGPLRIRAWGLFVNFLFNALALYGLSRMLSGDGGLMILGIGAMGTLICIAVVATPARVPGRTDRD